jgi:hypothetical protein
MPESRHIYIRRREILKSHINKYNVILHTPSANYSRITSPDKKTSFNLLSTYQRGKRDVQAI